MQRRWNLKYLPPIRSRPIAEALAGEQLDVLPHGIGPGLCAEDPVPQGKPAEVDADFLSPVEDVQEVAGRAPDEIPGKVDLFPS